MVTAWRMRKELGKEMAHRIMSVPGRGLDCSRYADIVCGVGSSSSVTKVLRS